jgi:beta-N-acetylhexosaminidase
VLDDLRRVSWPVALTLFVSGAAAAILLALIINSGGGSAATPKGSEPVRLGLKEDGTAVKARPLETESESPPAERISIAKMVGQRFMVGLEEAAPAPKLLEDVRRGEIGGILVFARNSTPAGVGAAIAKLQRAAIAGGNPPLLIATDQEGGRVKRFEAGPPNEPLSSFTPTAALREGIATGSYLRRYGVNVDLAPVVDLGLPGSFMTEEGRTISPNPAKVAGVASAFAGGLEQTRVMAVAKHFPGLGHASSDSDNGKSVVEAGVRSSLEPYERLIAVNPTVAIMASTAFYTRLDPSHGAAWSPKIVTGLLRNRLGFEGVVISDALDSEGVGASLSPSEAATATARAGIDVLMLTDPESFRPAYEAVLAAAKDGRIPQRNLASSYSRILLAKERFAR